MAQVTCTIYQKSSSKPMRNPMDLKIWQERTGARDLRHFKMIALCLPWPVLQQGQILKFYKKKNGASHMTNLTSMPIYHKPLKSSSKLMGNPMVLKSGRNERGLGVSDINKWRPCAYLDLFCNKVKFGHTSLICLSRFRPIHVCVVSVRMAIGYWFKIVTNSWLKPN